MDNTEQILGLRKYLLNYARSISSNAYYVEDAVQEATIKAVRKVNTFNNKSSLRSWVTTITRNTLIDMARRNKIYADEELVERAEDSHEDHTDLENEALNKVDELDQETKDVVVMSSLLGLKMRQISFVKGYSLGKVHSIASNGFNTLKEQLTRK